MGRASISLVYAFTWFSICGAAYAEIPYTFSAGAPARAEEVNRNFSDLDQRVTNVSDDIVSVSSRVTSLSNDILANNLTVNALQSDISGNASNITSLVNKLASIASDMSVIENNVSYVESSVSSLTQRVSVIEDTSNDNPVCASSGTWWSKQHKVTYDYALSTVGQEINVSGATYRIVAIPFKEFGTGDMYTIKFPIKEISTGKVSGLFSSEHSSNNYECSQFMISGYPAYGSEVTERRMVLFNNSGYSESKSNIDLSYVVSIKIGETVITVSISVGKTEISSVVSAGDFDFTDDIPAANMVHDPSLLSFLDTLVDYIDISKTQ